MGAFMRGILDGKMFSGTTFCSEPGRGLTFFSGVRPKQTAQDASGRENVQRDDILFRNRGGGDFLLSYALCAGGPSGGVMGDNAWGNFWVKTGSGPCPSSASSYQNRSSRRLFRRTAHVDLAGDGGGDQGGAAFLEGGDDCLCLCRRIAQPHCAGA